MKRKKTGFIAIISIVLAIVLEICFLRLKDQSGQNENDEIQSATTTEPTVECLCLKKQKAENLLHGRYGKIL